MLILGDVHGKFDEVHRIMSNTTHEVICVGDLGIGLPTCPTNDQFGPDFKFLRGNHDNPEVIRTKPGFLGDYGVYKGIFFIGGAASVDVSDRITGVDHFVDEELSERQFQLALELYLDTKPTVVVSHEAPMKVVSALGISKGWQAKAYRTRVWLQIFLESHAPKSWYFGHHHTSWTFDGGGSTRFQCLNELELALAYLNGS